MLINEINELGDRVRRRRESLITETHRGLKVSGQIAAGAITCPRPAVKDRLTIERSPSILSIIKTFVSCKLIKWRHH